RQRLVVTLPGKGVELGLQIAGREIRHVEQQMPAELAPAEFAEEFFHLWPQFWLFVGGEMRGVPDLPRADLAKPQMRRQAGGAGAVGPVAIAGIRREAVL